MRTASPLVLATLLMIFEGCFSGCKVPDDVETSVRKDAPVRERTIAGTPASGAPVVEAVSPGVFSYRTDEGGVVFVDDIEKIPERYRKNISTTLRQITKLPASKVLPNSTPEHRTKVVTVYLTSWCPYCKSLERDLRKAGIPHRALDIEKNTAALREFRDLGGSGVPLVSVGGTVVDSSVEAIRVAALR